METKLRGRVDKIIDAEAYLTERENKLYNSQSNISTNSGKASDPFSRGIMQIHFQKTKLSILPYLILKCESVHIFMAYPLNQWS